MNNGILPARTNRLVGYFPSWGIHAQNYHITDIPAGQLSHVIYAFADVNADGNCVSVNADDDKVNFTQLIQLKQQHPKLQILISVGGASHSANFPNAASTDATRLHFAQSCVQFMKQNGFDGIDIDWEYPTAAQKQNFTALLTELRHELDALGATDKRPYLLTIAAPAGAANYSNLQLNLIHPYLDWINLMAYDFTVPSSNVTDFVAPLKPYDSSVAKHATSNVDAAVQAYLNAGVPAGKLVLGTRFVGTGWQGVGTTNNGLYQSNKGPAKGTWDAAGVPLTGSFGYQDLENNYLGSYPRNWHGEALVSWLYSVATGIMISYEDPQSLTLKADYVLSNTLGGIMIWELSADDEQHTLINTLADALGQTPDIRTYTITGRVTSPDSASVGELQVQLVDKVVGPDLPLRVTTTNAAGQYEIRADISDTRLQSWRKTQPDLQVRVSAGNTYLASSAVRYNASIAETLDVVLPAGLTALPSEHETLTAGLTALYTGRLGELRETAQQQDVTYLANKSGWDARAVALAALADQFSQITAPAPAAPAPAAAAPSPTAALAPAPAPAPAPATVSLKPEFYYALFRAGLPADADGLFQASPKVVQAVWQQAITQGVIPQALSSEVAGAVQSFLILGAAHTLDAPPPVGLSTLRQMLQTSLSDAGQQQSFAALYAQYRDDPATFWSTLQKSLGPNVTKQLQLNGQLFYLTLNNAPLVGSLLATEKQSPLTSTLDLASRGYYDAAKWVPLIGTAIPSQIPGSSPDEQRANYARLLAAQVRVAFPTAVVADLVLRGTFTLSDKSVQPAAVTSFLNANQGKFEIDIEPIEAYIARTKLSGTSPAVVAQIKRLQRVFQLTPDDSSMAVLLQQNLDSAYAITGYDSAGFVRAFQDKLGGAGTANQIHARAKQIYSAVLNIAVSYLGARVAPTPGGKWPIHVPFPPPPSNPSYPVIAYPTLESLFGSLDYCDCQDCRSILSPAAYLVDLLHYVDQPSPTAGYQNPQSVLFQRRPDLQYLPLTCENTNTALPYIDLANETLEYFVANSLSLANYQGHNTDGSVSSDELMASPQYVNDAAYTTLQNIFFPPPLPFNRPLALLRLHLQKIGVALQDVMAAIRASDAIERGGTIVYGWRDILMEQIGLSREEYQLLTDSSIGLVGLYGYHGETEVAALSTLQTQNLQGCSRRTGVSYQDLFSIIQTQFINPNSTLIPPLEQLDMPFSTLQQLQNGTLTSTAFEALLPVTIDPRKYGGTNLTDKGAIVTWVKNNYTRIMTIIAYTDPGADPDPCSATNLVLRYTNPDNTANLLRGADFLRLMRFVRLWRKLGLSIEQTDDIITALYPSAYLPTGSNDATDYQLLDKGFLALLPRIGFLYQVMNRLSLTTDSLSSLLACWAPIDNTGTDSLYGTMFLNTPVQDTAFAIDAYGKFLQDNTQTLGNHQATLCAAFNLTGTEFDLILPACGLTDSSVLNLANISAIYRIGWMAHTLQLSVVEFLLLRTYTGLDPFLPLDPSTTLPAEPPVIRFMRLVQVMNTAGLQPVQALYLMWNQDISGKSTPPDSDVTGLAASLRADFAAVESQFTLVDDPDGSTAKRLMAMVYGSSGTDFFFGLLIGTLATSVGYSSPIGTLAQPIIDASKERLSYDDLRKQLTYIGVLDAATQSAIDAAITANGNDPSLHAALASLSTSNHQAVDPFFATYPELLPLYAAFVESNDPPQQKRTTLLANFLPSLKQKRKQEQALAAVTAAAGADPSFATSLLQDPTILHSAGDATLPAISDLTAIETQGLSAKFYLTNNPSLPADKVVDAVASLNYAPAPGPNSLPAGHGGSAIAGNWSGYINVPQDGFYNISIATDAGAIVSLLIDGTAVSLAASGNVWKNQGPISLTAGALVPIALAVGNIKNNLAVSWESLGLGWQIIPGTYLYSGTLLDRLRTIYVRFLKASSLASALSLTADEIAYFGTATSFRINTTDGHDNLAAGNATFTPVSMSNINNGSVLVIDNGGSQEIVTVTGTTPTTFSAAAVNPHNGTVTPFAIVSRAFPNIGQGWLNFLAVSQPPDLLTAASLRDVLTALLDFARIKHALSPSDERLLAVLQNPALTLADDSPALLALTGWAQDSLSALLQQFFGNTQLANLSSVENVRRVYEAYAIVNTCRVTAAALIAATTNAPSATAVSALQSALQALYAEPDWLTVVRPINDAMRIQQRDALVAYILQQFGDSYAKSLITTATVGDVPAGATQVALASVAGMVTGMQVQGANIASYTTVTAIAGNTVTITPGTLADVPPGSNLSFVPGNAVDVKTADKLFEYFLIDVETQPPVETSRIRLALSSVQLFIERILRNLEPQVSPTDIDGSLWSWMKRYRVWQANREVFLWPENWLYPELRDDQSPFFQQMMSGLLQSDITDDAAATAYLDYLTSLEEVAKLEPCGLYYLPATNDTDETSYVIARTAGAHRKYYFRQLQYGGWTPWTEVKIDCEDMPITPIVWNGRLFLFWLKILKQTTPPVGDLLPSGNITSLDLSTLQSNAQTAGQAQNQVTIQAMLCWSEFYNGKWQPTKTSDVNRPTRIGAFDPTGPKSFDVDRNLLRIFPIQIANDPLSMPPLNIPSGALILAIDSPAHSIPVEASFILYNTHSLPILLSDIPLDQPFSDEVIPISPYRWLFPKNPYTGATTADTFRISYGTTSSGGAIMPLFTNNLIGLNLVPRCVEPQPGSDAWGAPFFFEDRRNIFYVTTSQTYQTIRDFAGFGILSASPSLQGSVVNFPPLVLQQQPKPPKEGDPILVGNVIGGGAPVAIQGYVSQSRTLRAALGSGMAASYDGRQIGVSGSLANLRQTKTASGRSD